ncbi:MAG: redoxin domain-containing protein [Elusimicrobiota bacterium]
MKKKVLLFSLLALMQVFTGIQNVYSKLVVGQDSPNFSLKQVPDGKPVTLDELLTMDGKRNVVVLSYFNRACQPCMIEIPHLEKVAKTYAGKNVKFVLISVDKGTIKDVDEFVKSKGWALPVLFDPFGVASGERFGVIEYDAAKLPMLFVISKNKKVAEVVEGLKDNIEEILKSKVDALLTEEAKPLTAVQKQDSITVIFTNSANGYVESCNCPSNPYGGLVRRVTCIKELKGASPNNLVLDSGDNFSPYSNSMVNNYVVKLLKMIGYDAVGIGDQELMNGMAFLRKEIDKKEVPFLVSNMMYCDDKACINLTPMRIEKTVGSVKIGIVSVISPKVFVLFPKDKKKNIKIEESSSVVKGFIEANRDKYDLIVVLSHMGVELDQELAAAVPGIDLIIGGHTQSLLKSPIKVGETYIVQAGEKGQNVGRMVLEFNEKKKITGYQYQMVPLTDEVIDDPEARDLVNEYKEKAKMQSTNLKE